MAGLPKLPGFTFNDPTLSKFHRSQTFDIYNGYKLPRMNFTGVGGQMLDVNGVKFVANNDPVRYDPSLTYGRTREQALPQFIPHYVTYDQKCLTFKAFFKQSVVESPNEYYRVRQVNIIYFLEDDSITVMEPKVENCGIDQGRLIRRGPIPRNQEGVRWHWKDFNVGRDVCFYGTVFHTVDCDTYTREYMLSQGLVMAEPEQMPPDPYIQQRQLDQHNQVTSKTPSADDKLRRFLEYDGKILKFKALWDDRDSEYGEIRAYEILYFLADDTVAVKELHGANDGRDPYPQLLRKTKLPKVWTDRPVDYPSIYLELSDNEVVEYYKPSDFLVGETIFVLGRRMLLYDCDKFTRNYFRKVLCYEQMPAIDIREEIPKPDEPKPMPPHDGFGSLEDSLQNTLTFMPKPPRQDVMKQLLNANKYLKYEMKMDDVHPEDTIRKFLLFYSLADGTCYVIEPQIRNSGFLGGKYLRKSMIIKPGSDPLNPDFYTAGDFYIGAVITVYTQRFIIIGADLYVYRYMQANPEKFPCLVIENIRNYMFKEGHLNEDITDQVEETKEAVIKARRDALGKEIKEAQTEMEKCLQDLKAGGENYDPQYEKEKMAQILQEYEDTQKHTSNVPPYGILPVNKDCAYPIKIGNIQTTDCTADPCFKKPELCPGSYTPKHIDSEEEKRQKYYDAILRRHKDICENPVPIECTDPPELTTDEFAPPKPEVPNPLMVHPAEYPPDACNTKQVRFAEHPDKCLADRYDLCYLKRDRNSCDCTDYDQCKK